MKDKFYDPLAGLLSIKSVAVDSDKEGAPFGDGCRDALDYMLWLCDSFGFRTKKIGGGLMGYAEIGEGDEIIGILAHLDVVPEGSGWEYPCFGLTRATVDGEKRVYGRGISDDKGTRYDVRLRNEGAARFGREAEPQDTRSVRSDRGARRVV